MVITVLQAQVATEHVATLERIYREETAGAIDPGIVETYLVQNMREPATWQIITVWESREALDAMRATGETPRGIVIFRAAGAEPALTILRVAEHATPR